MIIEYRTQKLRKVCTLASVAQRKYGAEMAFQIQKRIQEIDAAESVEQMVQYCIGRCHPLKGDRTGQFAVDLVQPHRLVFTVTKNGIEIAKIEEIVKDYH